MIIRRLLLLDLALLALMILASRLALVIHEAAGHALPAWAFGARRVSISLSPLGGGRVNAEPVPSGAGYAIFCLGGIALNLLTGAAAWFAARRLTSRGLAHVFLLLLGAGQVGQAIFYLANGFYYGAGDPVGFGDLRSVQWMWLLFVPVFAAAAGLAARHFADWLAGHVTLDTPSRRLAWPSATIGIVTLAYLGLWGLTWREGTERTLSQIRHEEEVAREVARRRAVAEPATVLPEEVRDRVPPPVSVPVLLAAAGLGAGLALWRARPQPVAPAEVRPWHAGALAAMASAVAGAIALLAP